MARVKRAANNYINKKDLLAAITPYAQACRLAKAAGTPLPRIPEKVGKAILDIANHLATKGNFSGYSWKEEFIEDGIENCCLYLHNFDERVSDNPFGYISLIITNAFIRRIQKEKQAFYIKAKVLQKGMSDLQLNDEVFLTTLKEHDPDYISIYIKEYEEYLVKKKQKAADKKQQKISDELMKNST